MYIYRIKNNMKKVIIVSYYWDNEDGVGRLRWKGILKYLKGNGLYPIIFTKGNSNKESKYDDHTIITNKGFDINSFFSKIFKTQYSKGVIDSSDSIFIKLFSWFRANIFFPDPRVLWVRSSVKVLSEYIIKNKIKTIITTSPPHSVHLIGYKLKKITKINWIADFRDPYLSWDVLLNMKPNFLSKKIHQYYQNTFLKNADKVVVTNSLLKKEFESIITKSKLKLISNGSNLKFSNNVKSNNFIISYFGLINKFRDPKVFLNAIEEKLQNDNYFKSNFQLNFYGNIQKSTLNYIINSNTLNPVFNYTRNVDSNEINNLISESSILLLLLNNSKNQNTTPIKIFDYLVSGKQILTLGNHQNNDVDYLLKKYSRMSRCSYSNKSKINEIIDSTFLDFRKSKNNLISADYSKLEFKSKAYQYRKVISSL